MSSVVRNIRRNAGTEEYLGPAHVNAVSAHDVLVSLPEGEMVNAAFAFAVPYAPAVGDTLLVIGRHGRHYALGVIHGSGRTDLSFQGDVRLRSVGGSLRLSGDHGVEIRGPQLDIFADALRMVARDVFQTFESVCQRVRALLRVQAGETQTLVDRGAYTQSRTAAILAEDTVTVSGSEIHIG